MTTTTADEVLEMEMPPTSNILQPVGSRRWWSDWLDFATSAAEYWGKVQAIAQRELERIDAEETKGVRT